MCLLPGQPVAYHVRFDWKQPAYCDCAPAVQREANQLVEEFMLLANMSVAKIVADAFPDRALLRRHPPPDEKKLSAVLDLAKSLV